MKYILYILLLCFNAIAQAAPSDFGAGVMIGSIVSVTGKSWINDQSAVDYGMGFHGNDDISLYADYLWHIRGIFGSSTQFGRETVGYVAGGAGVSFWDDSYDCGRFGCDRRSDKSETGIFVRAFVGAEWTPSNTRLGVFAEVGPSFLLTPDVDTDLDVGIGARYYF